MLKWSIFAILTGFLCNHLPYIISHRECLCYYMPLYNRIIAQVLSIWETYDLEWRPTSVTLASNCRVCHVYYHSKCLKKSVYKRPNLDIFSSKSPKLISLSCIFIGCTKKKKKITMILNRPTSHGSIPNSIKINAKICQEKKCRSSVISISKLSLTKISL